MFPALSSNARLSAAFVALLALASVGMRFIYDHSLSTTSAADTVWVLARFFTILTLCLVALTFSLAAVRRNGVAPAWLAALTLAVLLSGAVYHLLLAHLVSFSGLGLWADHGLHTATPVACFAWWVAFAPKETLAYRDLPVFVVWPIVYVAYALARGAQDGIYPYPFMDLTELTSAAVITNLAGLLIVLLIGGVVFVMIGKFTDR